MKKTFNNVSILAFQCLGVKLQEQGLTLEGNAGYLSKNGISLDYGYDENTQELTIENLEVGFPASMVGMNVDKVLDILDKALSDCRQK